MKIFAHLIGFSSDTLENYTLLKPYQNSQRK
jgi:hypothetical protein